MIIEDLPFLIRYLNTHLPVQSVKFRTEVTQNCVIIQLKDGDCLILNKGDLKFLSGLIEIQRQRMTNSELVQELKKLPSYKKGHNMPMK